MCRDDYHCWYAKHAQENIESPELPERPALRGAGGRGGEPVGGSNTSASTSTRVTCRRGGPTSPAASRRRRRAPGVVQGDRVPELGLPAPGDLLTPQALTEHVDDPADVLAGVQVGVALVDGLPAVYVRVISRRCRAGRRGTGRAASGCRTSALAVAEARIRRASSPMIVTSARLMLIDVSCCGMGVGQDDRAALADERHRRRRSTHPSPTPIVITTAWHIRPAVRSVTRPSASAIDASRVGRPELAGLLPLELDGVDGDDVAGADEAARPGSRSIPGRRTRPRRRCPRGRSRPARAAEPHPVGTPQLIRQATSNGMSGSNRHAAVLHE